MNKRFTGALAYAAFATLPIMAGAQATQKPTTPGAPKAADCCKPPCPPTKAQIAAWKKRKELDAQMKAFMENQTTINANQQTINTNVDNRLTNVENRVTAVEANQKSDHDLIANVIKSIHEKPTTPTPVQVTPPALASTYFSIDAHEANAFLAKEWDSVSLNKTSWFVKLKSFGFSILGCYSGKFEGIITTINLMIDHDNLAQDRKNDAKTYGKEAQRADYTLEEIKFVDKKLADILSKHYKPMQKAGKASLSEQAALFKDLEEALRSPMMDGRSGARDLRPLFTAYVKFLGQKIDGVGYDEMHEAPLNSPLWSPPTAPAPAATPAPGLGASLQFPAELQLFRRDGANDAGKLTASLQEKVNLMPKLGADGYFSRQGGREFRPV